MAPERPEPRVVREVVLTGVGLATPLGGDLPTAAAACFAGRSAFRAVTLCSTRGSSVRYAGEHAAPDPRRLPDRKAAKILSRRDQTAVLTAAAACADAGLPDAGYAPARLGMFVGASCTHLGDLTPSLPLVAKHADLAAGTFDSAAFGREFMATLNPIVVLRLLMNNALCFGTIGLAIRGVNSNYMQHEVSGLRAVGEGYRAVAAGRADAVVAGGTAQPVEPFQLHEARHAGWLADQTAPGFDPARAVRPFDAAATGTILSEATAFVVLEDGALARRRGARILGRVVGFGLAADGEPDAARPAAPSAGLVRAFVAALAEAGRSVEDLGAVLGAAGGVAASDRREALGLVEVLGRGAARVPVASVKGAFGETGETHGALGVALAVAAGERRAVPPTVNFAVPWSGAESLAVAASTQPLARGLVAVVARSRYGVNAVLLADVDPIPP